MSEKLSNENREIFFTSDLHFGHNKDFLYSPRGFSSVEEHDEAVIKNWNETVGPNDLVFVLGDVMMGADRERNIDKLKRLNGKIAICRGNHDTNCKMIDYDNCPNTDQQPMGNETYANVIKIGKWEFYISHHPTIITDFNFINHGHKKFCLHGHTHSKDRFQFLSFCCYNVALDAHNNRPVNVREIQEDLRKKMQELFAEKQKI